MKKNNSYDDVHNKMPVVPSISNINDLPEILTENVPFPESDAEPEAILDIPSFSGMDTLNVATAITQTISDLEKDPFQKDNLPEIPVCSEDISGQIQKIPSFSDFDESLQEENQEALLAEMSEFEHVKIENMPEIPSLSDQNEADNFDIRMESLPDISTFLAFTEHTEIFDKKSDENDMPPIPELPENGSFHGNLQDDEKEILSEVPSVSDLDTISSGFIMNSMIPTFQDKKFLSDNPIEENSYFPEVPSVLDDDWKEKDIAGELTEIRQEFDDETLPIAELPLSLNALHDLQKIGIQNSLELLEITQEALESVPDINAKTLHEILHVRQLQQEKQAEKPLQQPVSETSELLLDEFLKELEGIGISEKKQMHLKAYLRAVKPECSDKKTCFATWYHELHVQLQLDNYITGLLRKRQMSGLSVEMLRESLPASLDKQILEDILQDMLSADRLIESRDGFYTLKYPPVLEFLADNTSEKEQHIAILKQRMNGDTPEQIAQEKNISKEHVLRVQNKILRLVQKLCLINRTSVYEERFRPLYETYDLTQEIFKILTKESEQVFRYLQLVSFPGSKHPEEVLQDMGVPGWVRENWQEYLSRKK